VDGDTPAAKLKVVSSTIAVRLFTDPGCPWGYSARPALARLAWRFGDQLDWRLTLIGLTDSPEEYDQRGFTPALMAVAVRDFERRFRMPFGVVVKPRMAATARACRAVIAAREISPRLGWSALHALQLLQFGSPRLLDDDAALRGALAGVDGLDADAIVAAIDTPEIVAAYDVDRALARAAHGTPTHIQGRHADSDGAIRYTAPSVRFEDLRSGETVEVGGFQPFESYDTVLANLAPDLVRRAAPDDSLAVLGFFAHDMTTAEVAAVMRSSDTDDHVYADTEARLIELAAEGRVVGRPVAGSATWRLATATDANRPDGAVGVTSVAA